MGSLGSDPAPAAAGVRVPRTRRAGSLKRNFLIIHAVPTHYPAGDGLLTGFPKTYLQVWEVYVPALRKEAVDAMREEALRLREEYLEHAEDMELYSKPEFWAAVEQVESGKTKKLSLSQLREELKL